MPTQSVVRHPLLAAAAASVTVLLMSNAADAEWSVEEKTIADLEYAYSSGLTTATNVVSQYVNRINTFDVGPNGINSVAQINPNLMADAARVDGLIASGATVAQYPLLGVPVLVKNSYDVGGMVTTNGVSVLNGVGTPGSTRLIAPDDAFSVKQLKDAGAIILGKAAMSTMAYSYNGVDNANGVVLNPYSPTRQPGGSSSGSGASVASNFAMLSMGGETGGSIRVPANHNALVGLKTSLGLVDPDGTFPLSPARDVVGPLAKSVSDVAYAMNALVGPSSKNLFNDTPFYPTSDPGTVRPANYGSFLDANALQGKVVAVPNYMAGRKTGGNAYEGNLSPIVIDSFNRALDDIRGQGATVVYVDIPAADTYYYTLGRNTARGGPATGPTATTSGFPFAYPTTTPGGTTPASAFNNYAAAYYYNALIESYNDPVVKNLRDFATALKNGSPRDANGNPTNSSTPAFPGAGDPRSTLTGAYNSINSLAAIWEAGNAKGFGDANNDGSPDNPEALQALKAFYDLRLSQYEGFMADPNLTDDPTTAFDESTIDQIDTFAAPTFATVAPLQGFLNPANAVDPFAVAGGGSLLGRFESNILGAPSISVPMGYAPDGTPMGIQFFNEFMGEGNLLGFAFDYEQATRWRIAPDLSFVPEPASLAVIVLSGLMIMPRRRRAV